MGLYCDDFAAWWLSYPRKTAKRKAHLQWLIALREIAADRECSKNEAIVWLLERTRTFASSPKGQAGDFCPYPTTWLFQGRYDDDIDEWQSGGNSAPHLRGPELDIEKAQEWRP